MDLYAMTIVSLSLLEELPARAFSMLFLAFSLLTVVSA
jgi:hypothetical protein